MITGIGGGLLRDILTGEIPLVLRREIYAVASLVGAITVAVGHRLAAPTLVLIVGSAALTCLGRVIAIRRGWAAPTARTT
jgi:uncharacterized membrane protein YeiH